MTARVVGAFEAAWNLFELRHVCVDKTLEKPDINLHEERQVLIWNRRLRRGLNSSQLERYFKRPSQYIDVKYVKYYETLFVYNKLRCSVPESESTQDGGSPRMYVVQWSENDRTVIWIRFASPTNFELFSLLILLVNSAFSYSDDLKLVGSEFYSTYTGAAVAHTLYNHGDEYETAVHKAARHHCTPADLRCFFLTCFQQVVNPKTGIEKRERAPAAYISDENREKRI